MESHTKEGTNCKRLLENVPRFPVWAFFKQTKRGKKGKDNSFEYLLLAKDETEPPC